ncbi:MAG: cupin domain-containing protein [Flexilinea sp.]
MGELEDLDGGMALGEATPLLMTAKPGTTSGTDAIVHTGQEFIYCLDGSIVYWVGDEEYILEKSDSLIFHAHIPHRWENCDGDTLKVLSLYAHLTAVIDLWGSIYMIWWRNNRFFLKTKNSDMEME